MRVSFFHKSPDENGWKMKSRKKTMYGETSELFKNSEAFVIHSNIVED